MKQKKKQYISIMSLDEIIKMNLPFLDYFTSSKFIIESNPKPDDNKEQDRYVNCFRIKQTLTVASSGVIL